MRPRNQYGVFIFIKLISYQKRIWTNSEAVHRIFLMVINWNISWKLLNLFYDTRCWSSLNVFSDIAVLKATIEELRRREQQLLRSKEQNEIEFGQRRAKFKDLFMAREGIIASYVNISNCSLMNLAFQEYKLVCIWGLWFQLLNLNLCG